MQPRFGRFFALALATLSLTWSLARPQPAAADTSVATFAGGCFWCMEKPFEQLDGVVDTISGYTGGSVENPSYGQVSQGWTGHIESVQVTYDPEQVTYDELLDVFWRNVDPLDDGGQFCDRGEQYETRIFYHGEQQRQLAEASKTEVAGELEEEIVTPILAAETFYPAEDYHQNYYRTHPVRYRAYRFACGRDRRLEAVWGEAPH
ncbi:MAG: peptide-methionine (S)-S-oxide reductase MsrA [Cyanobacteria bacterium P01_A01_bin.135]